MGEGKLPVAGLILGLSFQPSRLLCNLNTNNIVILAYLERGPNINNQSKSRGNPVWLPFFVTRSGVEWAANFILVTLSGAKRKSLPLSPFCGWYR
jgi:hypothetical protein